MREVDWVVSSFVIPWEEALEVALALVCWKSLGTIFPGEGEERSE